MVDSGVFHLDYTFDYLIPDGFVADIAIGSRVQVSFNGVRREGLVYEIKDRPEKAGRLLHIEKILGSQPVTTSDVIELVSRASRRWACHPYDIWRGIIPSRVIAAERNIGEPSPFEPKVEAIRKLRDKRVYLALPAHVDQYQALTRVISAQIKDGNVLLVLPDEKDISRFIENLNGDEVINLSSALPKSERYQNFLKLARARQSLVIGNRSSVFAPIPHLKTIVIHRELSENHYEARTPGWNSRDIALMRQENQADLRIIFTGYGPSSEMSNLIEMGSCTLIEAKKQLKIFAYSPQEGELIPSKLVSVLRQVAKKGSVLILVPSKGYASGLICSKCRNIAQHTCGGVLTRSSLKGPLRCSQCLLVEADPQCTWCSSRSFSIVGRGIGRISEEIGRSLPGIAIKESTAEHLIDEVDGFTGIVIATSGAQPRNSRGHHGVLILEAERFLAGVDMRARERVEESFFLSCAMVREDGFLGITLPSEHPVVAALSRWNFWLTRKRLLQERREALLPPSTHLISLKPPLADLSSIEAGLHAARASGRLPSSSRIYVVGSEIRLYINPNDLAKSTEFIHEYTRRRSITGKKAISLRIDPYQLN